MTCWFYHAQKVVCIDDGWVLDPAYQDKTILPKKDVVYTIRDIEPGEGTQVGQTFFRFYEITNPILPHLNRTSEPSFDSQCFRPLEQRKTDIGVLESLLRQKEQVQ